MQDRDHVLKVMERDQNVRLYVARTTALVQEAHRRHGTSATASAALGRVMTAAVMMASDLKGEKDSLTLRIEGNGPAGIVMATADSHGGVRGFIANPCADVPASKAGKLAVGELIGRDGFLEVIRDMGLKQPFTGRTPLVSGEIAEDLAHYYLVSEQIPSLISLGVLVGPDLDVQAAGGIFVQALPEAREEILEMIEKNIFGMGNLSNALVSYPSLEDMLRVIMQGMEYDIVGEQEIGFRCTCSWERLGNIIGKMSADQLALEPECQGLEVVCEFCRERYQYSLQELETLGKK